MKNGNESLGQFLQKPETTHQLNGLSIERLSDPATGDEAIKLYVGHEINDWMETEIGTVKIGPVTSIQTRAGTRSFIRIDYRSDASELLQHNSRNHKGRSNRHRTIPLNDQGVGFDQLGSIDGNTNNWLIVDAGNSVARI